MKRFLLTAILLILALSCAAVAFADDHVCSGGTATCDKLAVCATCGKPYGHLADHRWGAWVSDGSSTHTRTCQHNAGHKETRYHMGGASTCTEGAKCAYCGATHDEPLGHVPAVYAGYPATCITAGTTDGEKCTRCSVILTARRVIPAKGHSYNTWEPIGNGMHKAVCSVAGCGAVGEISCTPFEGHLGDTAAAVCPICGASGACQLFSHDTGEVPADPLVSGEIVFPTLISRMDDALPMGQLLVRGMAEPFPGALYAFTVTGSYAGKVIGLEGKTVITLPEDLSQLPAFTLLRVTAPEEFHGVLVVDEIPYRMENGQLSFTAEMAGLYLLAAAE